MRERVQAVRKRTWLAPLLIIAVTVLYLGLTAAFAQNPESAYSLAFSAAEAASSVYADICRHGIHQ